MKSILFNSNISCVIIFSIFWIGSLNGQVEVSSTPTCNFKKEGTINLIVDEDSLNYDLPFLVFWENLTTGEYQDNINMDDYEFTIQDLYPGEYEIIIYFTKDCKYYLETEVEEIETEILKFLRKPSQLTCGLADGKITLIPIDGVPEFTFVWSNGATTYEIGNPPTSYFIDNLEPGNYCVTITDQECGFAKYCIPIKEQFPVVNIEEINQIANCQEEPFDCTGKITIKVFGVINYTVEWLDPNREIIGTGNSISALCIPGSYLASIKYSPYCQAEIFEFFVPCCNDSTSDLDLELEVELGCQNENSIETIVTGGNPPYDYMWSNSSHEANLYNIAYGKYHVTVTDSTGCIVNDSVLLKPIETVSVTPACEGIEDGSISFVINNPTNCLVNVTYDWSICSDCTGYPLIQNDTSSVINLTLDELGGGIEYTYYVSICGCNIPVIFTLPEEPFETTFIDAIDHGNYTFECIYDIDCKDTHVDSGVVALATLSLADEVDCEGLFSKDCGSTKYYCEDELVGEKDLKAKVMRRMRAVLLAQTLGYDPELVDGTVGNGSPCDWVSVCPNDPTCVHGTAHGEFGGHFLGFDPLPNGCTRVKCKIAGIIPTSYKICGLEYIPDFYAAYYDPSIAIKLNIGISNCNPVEKNVGELIMYLDSLSYDYPNKFFYSELYMFLIHHLVDERKWCATVKYCASDFSFISSNITEVDCEPIEPALMTGGPGPIDRACSPYESESEIFYVFCHTDCPSPRPGIVCGPQPKVFVKDYGSFNPVGFSTNHPTSQLMARMHSSSSFAAFFPIKQDSNTISVNALYKDGSQSLLHQFSYESWNPYEFDDLEYLFQHPDSSYAFAIVRDSQYSEVHNIVYGDVGAIGETKLLGSTSLELQKIWSTDSLNFICGSFNGTLELDGNTLASNLAEQFFILNTDRNLDVNSIRRVNLNGWKVFVDEQTGDLAFWSPTSQGLYIDNQLQSNISTREIISLDGASSSSSIRDVNLILPSGMNLLEYKRANTYSAYLIAGVGTITLNGSQIVSTSTSKLVLLTISNSGSFNWAKDYTLSSIDTSEVSIEIINGDSIILGLNLIDNLFLTTASIYNSGGTDVLILGYDNSGTLVLNKSYGSASDESIKDLYFSNGILYFAGNLDENTFKRQLGNLEFINFSTDYSQGYISYILLDSTENSESLLFVNTLDDPQELKQAKIEVYPNPVREVVNVRVSQNCEQAKVFIQDLTGKTLREIESTGEALSIGLPIDISGFHNGVYFVIVRSRCAELISRPFVIMY